MKYAKLKWVWAGLVKDATGTGAEPDLGDDGINWTVFNQTGRIQLKRRVEETGEAYAYQWATKQTIKKLIVFNLWNASNKTDLRTMSLPMFKPHGETLT